MLRLSISRALSAAPAAVSAAAGRSVRSYFGLLFEIAAEVAVSCSWDLKFAPE